MELSPKQQTVELIHQAKKILLISHKQPDGDSIGATLALAQALNNIGKKVTAIVPSPLPDNFRFLPGSDKLATTFTQGGDLLIKIDTQQTAVSKLGYKQNKKTGVMTIVVTPKQGTITPESVTLESTRPKFDLIIGLDSPELERFGDIFENYAETFYETPLVNIDHHASNDYFGRINWVDLTATSTCEILLSLIESLESNGKKLLDENVATLLLTGIITDTGSFQNSSTTPKSFTIAAQLIASGAKQQEIIKQIFKTKPLSTLKLWGKALANLKEEKQFSFIWSFVTASDFKETKAQANQLSGVIDELIKSAPGVDFVMLISERSNEKGENFLHASLRSTQPEFDVAKIAKLFDGGGHSKASAFEINNINSFTEALSEVLLKIRQHQTEKTPNSTQKD